MNKFSDVRQWKITFQVADRTYRRVVTATSKETAKVNLFCQELVNVLFMDTGSYLDSIKSVEETHKRTPYTFVAENFNLQVEPLDLVIANGREGVVVEPPHSNSQSAEVYVYHEWEPGQDHFHYKAYHPTRVQLAESEKGGGAQPSPSDR